MSRVYRFIWDHSKGELSPPPVFVDLAESDSIKQLLREVSKEISTKSGGYQMPGFIMVVAHYIMLAIFLIIYCLIETAVKNDFTGLILIVAPFLSFIPIVYAMVREEPINKINAYLEDHEIEILQKLASKRFTMSSLFISEATIKGESFSFFQRTVLGRNFSGFVEFEEISGEGGPDHITEKEGINAKQAFDDRNDVTPMNDHLIEKNMIAPKSNVLNQGNSPFTPLLQEPDIGKANLLTEQKQQPYTK